MSKWIGLLLLTVAVAANGNQTCNNSVLETELPVSKTIEGQTLVLAGPARLELNPGETAMTIAHLPEMLIAKYPDGASLSHRWMEESEMREDHSSKLAFPDFIRLVFRANVRDASDTDRKEADAVWDTMTSGCINARHYQLSGTDIFTYSQTRASGERYYAFFILDDRIVHYLDIRGNDALANNVLATLNKRD